MSNFNYAFQMKTTKLIDARFSSVFKTLVNPLVVMMHVKLLNTKLLILRV